MESESGTDRIQVFVRVRPSEDNQCCFSVNSSRQIVFSGQNQRLFEFDHVADQDTTQESVFARVGKQIVESCVEGYNGTIFAYGQTGSGKTYTMLGPGEGRVMDATLKGLIPRSLDYLFELMNQKISSHGKNFEYGCRASFVEIYNEQIYDLLDNCSTRSTNLRESQTRGVYAEGIIERNVSNSWEAWNVLADGWSNRRVSETAMNRESSRSHAVFTLTVETKEHTDTGGITKVRQSVLNLVDLAGSERQKDTQSVGLQLREAGKINRSLSVLGQVIMALDEVGHGKTRFVPYRESKLTFLLRDSLGGNTKTFVIVNVHPNTQYVSETVSSLYFAQRAKQIRNRAKVNENTEGNVLELQDELKRLKQILAKYETEGERNGGTEENNDKLLYADKSGLNYCEKFIWAMAMLEQKENTISIHKTQIEKLQRYTLSRNFILKLRDAAIAAHEKGKTPTDNEEVVGLKKEVEKLKEQILHHPDKAKYQAEISLLQNELKSYQNAGEKVSQSRVTELKDLYTNLIQNDSLSSSFFGPSNANRISQSEETDKAILDSLKQTLKEHQQEIETLKENNRQLQSELNLSKSQVDELNKINDSDRCQASTQLNKFIDMHNATLEKVIGTPTRKRASLALLADSSPKKNKVESVPCAKLLDLSIPDSLDTPVEEDNVKFPPSIMDQSIPDIPGNEMEEALRQELQQMTEDIKRYQQMCFKKDEELAARRTSEFCLNEKLTNLSEINGKLEKNLTEISEDFKKEKKLRSDAEYEIAELKAQLKSLRDNSLQCNGNLQVLQESFNSMEAKYFEKVTEINSLTNQNEIIDEKIRTLTEDCESKNLELDVMKNESAALTAGYESEKKMNKDLLSELEATKATLSEERRNCETVLEQLEGKAKEVADEITNLRATNTNLSERNKSLQNQVDELNSSIEQKVAELDENFKNTDQLRNTVQSLQEKVQEHGNSYWSLEADKSCLQRDFDELLTKFNSVADELDKCKEENDNLQNRLITAEQDFQTKSEKQKFELECVQEDLIDVTESACKFEVQLLEKTNDFKVAMEERERLRYEIDLLKTKNEEATNHVEEIERKIAQMDEKHKQDFEIGKMHVKDKYEQKIRDVTKLKDEIAAELELVSAQLAESRQEVEQKCKDITRLKHSGMEKENLYQELKTAALENEVQRTKFQDKLTETTKFKELAEKEVSKVTKKNEELMDENASLAGHHNHQQKIRYLVKVKEQLHKAETDKTKLGKLIQKLVTLVKRHEPDFDVRKTMPEFVEVVSM